MLAFFRAFLWGKSIKHYSSILAAFSWKITNIFSTENRNENYFLPENEDLT